MEISKADEFRCEAVNYLSDFFSASTAAFFHWASADGIPHRLRREDIYFWHLDAEYQEIYFKNIYKDDPIRKWYGRYPVCPRVATLSSITSPEELRGTPLYKQILCPNKQRDVLIICLVIKNCLLGHISLTRPWKIHDFEPKEIQLARLFSTTLSAAYSRLLLSQNFLNLKDVTDVKRLSNCYGLTRREMQILDKISEGLNSTEIGEQLSISRWTVKNHLQSIYGKVGVNNRISLINQVAPFSLKIKFDP